MASDINAEVKQAVVDASDVSKGSNTAYQALMKDINGSAAPVGSADHQKLVTGVATELQAKGVIPALALDWAADRLSKEGITKDQLAIVEKAGQTNPDHALDSAFAAPILQHFDLLKGQNIDRDAAGNERDVITPDDIAQAQRSFKTQADLQICNADRSDLSTQLGVTGKERDQAKADFVDTVKERDQAQLEAAKLAKQQQLEAASRREEFIKTAQAAEAEKSQITVLPGEGYWRVASRALKADGHAHKNIEVQALSNEIQKLNGGAALDKGDRIRVRSEEDERKAVEAQLAKYDQQEAARQAKAKSQAA
jgi:hypothetical protein